MSRSQKYVHDEFVRFLCQVSYKVQFSDLLRRVRCMTWKLRSRVRKRLKVIECWMREVTNGM